MTASCQHRKPVYDNDGQSGKKVLLPRAKKKILNAYLSILIVATLFGVSRADSMGINETSRMLNNTYMQVQAKFIPAAFISIVYNASAASVDSDLALVSIRGVPEERIQMTCDIRGELLDKPLRDCSGSEKINTVSIVSGKAPEKEVVIAKDSHKAANTRVLIEVTYI